MVCDKCGYMGDLSDLPGDRDFRDMTQLEVEEELAKEMDKARAMFKLIGWHVGKKGKGQDYCPTCSEK